MGFAFVDDVAEEEDELLESARADEARFRAFRCFFVIEAFSAGKKVPWICRYFLAAAWAEPMSHGGNAMALGGCMIRRPRT